MFVILTKAHPSTMKTPSKKKEEKKDSSGGGGSACENCGTPMGSDGRGTWSRNCDCRGVWVNDGRGGYTVPFRDWY